MHPRRKAMSYEGREEYICNNGHYWMTGDSGSMFDDVVPTCPVCKTAAKYNCSIDDTNGYDSDNPYTYGGPKEIIDSVDIPHTDHYGNKYFTKLDLYKPLDYIACNGNVFTDRWRLLTKD